MEKPFVYKTQCELAIVSKEFDADQIAKEMEMQPTRSFKKGEQSISRHSGSVLTKPHSLWALKTDCVESDVETLKPHIDYLELLLHTKMDILKRYKNDGRFDVSIWFWIETNNSGFGFELKQDELDFLNSISNRIDFSLITNR